MKYFNACLFGGVVGLSVVLGGCQTASVSKPDRGRVH